MGYSFHFELAAMGCMIAALVVYYKQKHLKLHRNKMFGIALLLLIQADLFDVFRMLSNANRPITPAWLCEIILFIYFIVLMSYTYCYYMYVMAVMYKKRISVKARILWAIPYLASILLNVVSIWNRCAYYYETAENGVVTFVEGPLYPLIYIAGAFYLFAPLILVIIYKKDISKEEGRVVVCLQIILIACAVIEKIALPHAGLYYMVNCLVLFWCLLFLQNSDYYLDEVTGFFKMHGFEEVAKEHMNYNEPVTYLIIRIMNYNAMMEMYEDDRLTQIQANMAKIMLQQCGKKDFYHIAASTFAVITGSREKAEGIYQTLREKLPTNWTVDGEEIIHEYCYYIVETPSECDTVEELAQRVSYARSDHEGHHKPGELIELTHETVRYAKERQKVADLVEQAVMDNSIEIYFQPIYSLEKERITSLEVLSRLKDKDKKFVNPEFFIHVAEENRDILPLGEQIFRKACLFASQNHIFDMGIDDININLSPVQCSYQGLAEDLMRIAGEYDIPMSRLHLEITESGLMDKTEITDTLSALRQAGANIALDDFGTGYSNISSIVSLPVDFVKIDKSLVWSYARGDNKYLDQLVPMIHAEGKRIISEGIETQEHIDIFRRLHGDFLQGYYYSKPIPEQEFIKYLKKANESYIGA